MWMGTPGVALELDSDVVRILEQLALPVPLGSRHLLTRRGCLRLGLGVLAGGRMLDVFALAARAG